MKKTLIALVLVSLVAIPALAAECPDGQHWVEENTIIPGYFEDGECIDWAEQTCEDYEWQCSRYWKWMCIDWDRVCVEWSEPVCNEYEQIWVEEEIVEGGYCVANPVYGCTNPKMSTYNPDATVDDGSCKVFPTALLKPTINSNSVVMSGGIGGVTFSFLTNKFMSCGLLVSQSSQQFAVNADSLPTLNGWTLFGSSNDNYGYNQLTAFEDGLNTYHQIGVPLERGNYFIRPLCDYFGKDILGSEYPVTIR